MSDNDDDDDCGVTTSKGVGILDVKLALEKTFQGCRVHLPPTLAGSFHAEVTFSEYEVRVILTGPREGDRTFNYRFMQRIEHEGRKPTKRMILEVDTKDPAELIQAIEDTKAHLLGVVFAINRALKPITPPRMGGVDDLLKG
jgi:hypothetical protein